MFFTLRTMHRLSKLINKLIGYIVLNIESTSTFAESLKKGDNNLWNSKYVHIADWGILKGFKFIYSYIKFLSKLHKP